MSPVSAVFYTEATVNHNGEHTQAREWSCSFSLIPLHLLCLSGQNNESEKTFMRTKEYVCHQNKDYVGGATC